MTGQGTPHPLRRARRSFWLLLVVSVLAAGSLSSALTATASPRTGLRVAGSGVLLTVSILLAARACLAIDRAVGAARHKAVSSEARHTRLQPKGNPR